jgi:hypothetical protein
LGSPGARMAIPGASDVGAAQPKTRVPLGKRGPFRIHPEGFEPSTFGSVDRCSRRETSGILSAFRQGRRFTCGGAWGPAPKWRMIHNPRPSRRITGEPRRIRAARFSEVGSYLHSLAAHRPPTTPNEPHLTPNETAFRVGGCTPGVGSSLIARPPAARRGDNPTTHVAIYAKFGSITEVCLTCPSGRPPGRPASSRP